MNIAETLSFIGNEVNRAKELHKGNFHNAHEALGVIRAGGGYVKYCLETIGGVRDWGYNNQRVRLTKSTYR